jgi:nitrite reductase/ring-hydroxylating ferredoxin subunit
VSGSWPVTPDLCTGLRSLVVARADEIAPGERKLVTIGGRSIGVFNVGGEYYALRNRCPHQGGPLCEGTQFAPLRATVPGEPYRRGDDGTIIRCPWHGWEFDIRTGDSWFDPERTRVRAYQAKVVAGAELEQLQAETYPARRDGDYVVVEFDR